MTTLAELKTSVATIIAKSGMDSEITHAILSAIRTLHTSGYYYRDLIANNMSFPSGLTHVFAYGSTFSRFRSLRYLRRVTTSAIYLTQIPVENWGPGGTDIFIMDNTNITMAFTTPTSQVDYAYYAYPDINSAYVTSWIADNYPELVAQKAAVILYNQLGQYDKASMWGKIVAEAEANFKRDNSVSIVGM